MIDLEHALQTFTHISMFLEGTQYITNALFMVEIINILVVYNLKFSVNDIKFYLQKPMLRKFIFGQLMLLFSLNFVNSWQGFQKGYRVMQYYYKNLLYLRCR